MQTASGMIIRQHRGVWPEVRWPVIARRTQKGWRTGTTRIYTLKCGHYFSAPASRAEGKGQTANCMYCVNLWRWLTDQNQGAATIDYALRDIRPNILSAMHEEARRQGKLIRPIDLTQTAFEESVS